MKISHNVLKVAEETYTLSRDISFMSYCEHLQKQLNDFNEEQVLKKINLFMGGKWFVKKTIVMRSSTVGKTTLLGIKGN